MSDLAARISRSKNAAIAALHRRLAHTFVIFPFGWWTVKMCLLEPSDVVRLHVEATSVHADDLVDDSMEERIEGVAV
jgi:hypothetical protein